MAKKAYIGVNNIAKEVKKIYIGVGGVAKKVKKGYIGVNGVAKLFFNAISGAGPVSRIGTTTLSYNRTLHAATTIGDYALFGGGYGSQSYLKSVEGYDQLLTHNTNISDLSDYRRHLTAASTSTYACFLCGDKGVDTTVANCDTYDNSLTRSKKTTVVQGIYVAAASLNGDIFLAGGETGVNTDTLMNTVWVIQDPFTISYPHQLQTERCTNSGTVGDYVIFAGGGNVSDSSATKLIDVYDSSYTKVSTSSQLNMAISYGCNGLEVPGYVIFPQKNTNSAIMSDVFDTQLVHSSIPQYTSSGSRSFYAAGSIGNYAIMAGGSSNTARYNEVNIYDDQLTETYDTTMFLSAARDDCAAASIGNYLLVGGGSPSSTTYSDVVDIYSI